MEDKVMASVNGTPIMMSEVIELLQRMGQQGAQYNSPEGIKLLVEELITQKLLYLDATKNGLAFEAEFKEQLEQTKINLLTNYAFTKIMRGVNVTPAQCKERYMQNPELYKKPETVNASHILVDSEELALDIHKQITADEISFEDAAKKYSNCPSKEKGGNLGDFGKGNMVKEFEDAAFGMEVGAISEPVQTQFGYHIIKVMGKNESQTLSFEEAQQQIMQQLTTEQQKKALESKVNQLKIVYPVDIPGEGPKIVM